MTDWTRVPRHVREAAATIPQSRAASRIAEARSRRSLRILGFHGVEDLDHFENLLTRVLDRYNPVSADEVVAATKGAHRLPDNAVWVTFDDGLPSTFDAGPLLQRLGTSATAFVCPSSVITPKRLWFQTVEATEDAGLRSHSHHAHPTLRELKQMPDAQRRSYVSELEGQLAAAHHPPCGPLGVGRLQEWVAQGHSIGNHTWDHPCLDTCSKEEQEDQIMRAHDALRTLNYETRLFAYPNGNRTAHSQAVLKSLRYDVGLLFDHRLTRDLSSPLRLSRLRIDSTAGPRRVDSILSGAHSAAFHVGTALMSRSARAST